ncbi:MAG: ABC transporter permease [Anaerolineae bacterium]
MSVAERTRPWAVPSRFSRERLADAVAPLVGSPTAMFGLAVVVFWILVAILAPWITIHDPLRSYSDVVNKGPSAVHWLGTDDIGRDLWSRLAFGARLILLLSPISVLAGVLAGSLLGLVSAYFKGFVDEVVMLIVNALMSFPHILLYMIVISVFGPSAINIVWAIALGRLPGVTRLVRSMALDVMTRDYIAAAKLRGERPLYIMFAEVLPNTLEPLIADSLVGVGYAAFSIGALGFLGLGVPPPAPDWGGMVSRGRAYVMINPWPVVWPALAISSLIVGLNLLSDGLREAGKRRR